MGNWAYIIACKTGNVEKMVEIEQSGVNLFHGNALFEASLSNQTASIKHILDVSTCDPAILDFHFKKDKLGWSRYWKDKKNKYLFNDKLARPVETLQPKLF